MFCILEIVHNFNEIVVKCIQRLKNIFFVFYFMIGEKYSYYKYCYSILLLALHSCAYVVDLERSSHGVFTSSDAIEMSDFCVDKVIDTIELVQLKFKSFSTNIG